MKVLVAEDDLVARRTLEAMLSRWGYEVTLAADGVAAWQILRQPDRPLLAVLDWMLPVMDGLEVVRKVRTLPHQDALYIIMFTAKGGKENVIAGLNAGADDCLIKPFEREELRARLRVGQRILKLQSSLAQRVRELGEALASVKQLQGLLPICSYCKRIRHDGDYWQQVEMFIAAHSDAQFSHSICPSCYESIVTPELEQLGATPSDAVPEQDHHL